MMERNKLVQKNIFSAVISGLFLNAGVSLATTGSKLFGATTLSRALFMGAVVAGIRVPIGMLRIRRLDDYNERFGVKR